MAENVEQSFVTLASGQQLHFRRIGSGPPLIMLHPSPQNGEALLQAAEFFSAHCCCLILDTPGYGLSEPLTKADPDIEDYAHVVLAAADALGIEKFCLYGAATGSQIGIQVSKSAPDRVSFLMLDSNGHVADSDREHMLQGYFPTVTPLPGGGHLMTYWEMCRSLFIAFPWTSGKRADRFLTPVPPPALIQNILLRYLQAGERYDLAYRVAFEIENRDHLNGLITPTVMTRWANSPVVSIADNLIEAGLPDCVDLLHAEGDISNRYEVQSNALAEALPAFGLRDFNPTQDTDWSGDRLRSAFLGAPGKQIYSRLNVSGAGTPLVCLHNVCRSAHQLEQCVAPLIGKRPVILIDLPGHGASTMSCENPSLKTLAAPISEILRTLGITEFEILGSGLGTAIGAALAETLNVKHIYGADMANIAQGGKTLKNLPPDLTPNFDGTHLIAAWNWVRSQELGKTDADADLCPVSLHQKTVELLRTGAGYRELIDLTSNLEWAAIFDGLNCDHIIVQLDELAQQLQ